MNQEVTLLRPHSQAAAGELARKCGLKVLGHLHDKRSSWAGHVVKPGCQSGEPDVYKFLVAWNTLSGTGAQLRVGFFWNQMSRRTMEVCPAKTFTSPSCFMSKLIEPTIPFHVF